MSKKFYGSFTLGMLVGGAIGTVAGMWVSPRHRAKARVLLKKSAEALPELAEDLSSSVQLEAHRLSGTAWHHWEQTLGRWREAIAVGIEATQQELQNLNHIETETETETAAASAPEKD
ncbi:MAG: hypothetical protein Fur0025_31600 [Oscillatoriaceae cyanobacterium]